MRVLAIANSFGVDANRYLHQIAKADGERLEVVTLYIAGCSLEQHYRNVLGDNRVYGLYYNGQNTGFFVSVKEALLSRQWDVVTLQQQSALSADSSSFEPYDGELYSYVKKHAPGAKIMLHQTWAYEDGSEKLENTGYKTAEAMFADIESAYAQCHRRLGTDGIIPSGKLLMNLLQSGIKQVHRDTFHASLGLGRYALGLLWYRMLTGNSAIENSFCALDQPALEEEIRIVKMCVDAFPAIL